MQVVRTSNLGRSGESPGYDECLLASGLSLKEAEDMALGLNNTSGSTGLWFYMVKSEDYQLRKFVP